MKTSIWVCAAAILISIPTQAQESSKETPPEAVAPQPTLEAVASFPKQQVTGVAVSKEGRIFVNFPFWSDDHTISVAEVMKDGSLKPFPDESWQAKTGHPSRRWVCVQSVYVDDSNTLWILDPAAPKMEAVVKGGAKLVKVDLSTNQVTQTITFPDAALPEKSYLNDVRVDTKKEFAYLTESGVGALFTVDLKNGKVRRLLAEHPAVKAEPEVELIVDGIKLVDPKTGQTPQIHADGIALEKDGEHLYFHALTGRTLYRIKTEDLRNEKLAPEELAKKVEKVAETPAPDGMLMGERNDVYLAAFEKNAIERYDSKSKKVETVVSDPKLQWPDSLSWGPDGMLYVTTSQIHRMPKFNQGKNEQAGPFMVYRLKVNGKQ